MEIDRAPSEILLQEAFDRISILEDQTRALKHMLQLTAGYLTASVGTNLGDFRNHLLRAADQLEAAIDADDEDIQTLIAPVLEELRTFILDEEPTPPFLRLIPGGKK